MAKKFLSNPSRRKFIHQAAKAAMVYSFAPGLIGEEEEMQQQERLTRTNNFSANDQVQIALIGAGGMGTADANTAITVPGVKIIAACDLYDGRIEAAKKLY